MRRGTMIGSGHFTLELTPGMQKFLDVLNGRASMKEAMYVAAGVGGTVYRLDPPLHRMPGERIDYVKVAENPKSCAVYHCDEHGDLFDSKPLHTGASAELALGGMGYLRKAPEGYRLDAATAPDQNLVSEAHSAYQLALGEVVKQHVRLRAARKHRDEVMLPLQAECNDAAEAMKQAEEAMKSAAKEMNRLADLELKLVERW